MLGSIVNFMLFNIYFYIIASLLLSLYHTNFKKCNFCDAHYVILCLSYMKVL